MQSASLIRRKFKALAPVLDERTRRLFAAAEAQALGYGGVSCVAQVTGVSRRAIHAGLREIARGTGLPAGRIRKAGAGRKRATERDPGLPLALERLVDPLSRGDPSRRSAGPARARNAWRTNCASAATRPPRDSSRRSCMPCTTACKGTAKPKRGDSIRTAMRNSRTSMRR